MSGPGERVEVVGAHLRARGQLALGRFPRLADLVNHDRGVIVLHDAAVLDGAGEPTGLALPELVVAQDEITFIVEGDDAPGGDGTAPRCVVFTPAWTISGGIHRFRDPSLANFLSATDPRFFEVTEAIVRSVGEPWTVDRHGCVLVNRTQVSAMAELPQGDPDPAEAGPPAQAGLAAAEVGLAAEAGLAAGGAGDPGGGSELDVVPDPDRPATAGA